MTIFYEIENNHWGLFINFAPKFLLGTKNYLNIINKTINLNFMRKFYSLFAFVAMMVVSLSANAAVAAETLSSNLETVASYFEGYGVYHYYNFKTMARDGGESQTFTLAPEAADGCVQITTPDFEIFSVGTGRGTTEQPDVRWRDANYGLYDFGSGGRTFRISSLKAGMIVVIQGHANGSYDYFEGGVANASEAEEITEEVTAKLNEGLEEGAEPVANPYRYFRILADGKFDFTLIRACYIPSLAILLDQSAGEVVSTPSLKIVGVNGDSRKLEFKPGESTMGNVTKTYYSIDGSDPIFLKDSEEVDTWTYTYDEATGEKLDSVPATYKKVLDTDAVAEFGSYGDYEFNIEDGYIEVFGSDDEDGDGIVVVKAAAVSVETGVVSQVVTIEVSIGEIQLNAPEVTLVGIEGLDRVYSINWKNNTICGEEYVISVQGDNDEVYLELEPNTGIGEQVTVKNNIKVTVSVNGYVDGVLEQEALNSGVEIKRKNAVTDAEGNVAHNYDFVNLTLRQKALLRQDYQIDPSILIGCYIINGEDTIRYSAEEFIEGVAADGTDIVNATPILEESGWYAYDSGNERTSRVVVEGGEDQNADGYGYAEEKLGLWNGLQIANAPYVNSKSEQTSSMLLYNNGDLGLYLGTKPTITFPRNVAAAGEYVFMYIGYGGSNYTNSRYPVIYEVPAGELLSVTLGNGPHLFYIDIYTYEGLPTDEYDDTAVSSVKPGIQPIVGYYSINGAKIAAPQKGINIVKYADGTTMKVLVK